MAKTAATFRSVKITALLSVEMSGSCSSEYLAVSEWRLQMVFVFMNTRDLLPSLFFLLFRLAGTSGILASLVTNFQKEREKEGGREGCLTVHLPYEII